MICFLASAVSSDPPTIAPACPIVRPAGAVTPAMKPTTGFCYHQLWSNVLHLLQVDHQFHRSHDTFCFWVIQQFNCFFSCSSNNWSPPPIAVVILTLFNNLVSSL
jgi:hypothetical protein